MYLIKNAWKSIVRAPGRNILIGIIVVLIAISSCVALSIRNSASEVVESYKESADIIGTLGVDREAMRSQMQSAGGSEGVRNLNITFTQPTIDEINDYGNSDYLKGYYYTINASLNSTDIEPVSNETETDTTSSSTTNQQELPNGGGGMDMRIGSQADFTLIGYSSNEAMTSFVSGDYTMSEGEMFGDDETGNICVISDELAAANDLEIGSAITMVNPNDDTSTLALTVSGIYQDNSTDDTSFNWFSNAANQILTNFTVLNNYVESTVDETEDTTDTETESTSVRGQISSTFLIKSSDSIAPFEAELQTKGLDENLTLTTNLDSVDGQLAPISNLSNFATIFLVLVLIIGGIILLVINMINIRERKYEVGVLRAIGMNKTKVAIQYISELFIVTTFAVIVGTSIGAVASVPTANMMLANEISTQTTSQTQTEQNFGRGGEMPTGTRTGPGGFFGITETTNYVDQINAVINPIVILELAGISILLTLLSGIISVVFIARYEPLKILSNR